MGTYILVILKDRMYNPSLIGIHRLKRNRPLGPLNLISKVLGKVFKCILPSLPVILGINLNPYIFTASLINNKACKILESIKCLSPLTDKNAHFFTRQFNIYIIAYLLNLNVYFHVHCLEYLIKEFLRIVYKLNIGNALS